MLSLEEILKVSASRWLQSLCLVPQSSYYGLPDREYWAWKTKDFHNSTWIGGLAGILDCRDLLDLSEGDFRKVVEAVITGAQRIQRKNGGFEEAYPFEDSYAVTGLVLFNLLYALRCYRELFTEESVMMLKVICRRAVTFLETHTELHGVISNHLVTSACALSMAYLEFEIGSGDIVLSKILALQKKSGSFPEYGGADPGYQTLLNHYLMGAMRAGVNKSLLDPALRSSLSFVENFAMPDGDFSGELGSRGTRIVYPSGIQAHSGLSKWFQETYLKSKFSMDPLQIDAGNFVPLFNAWTLAYQNDRENFCGKVDRELPSIGTQFFDEEALLIVREENSQLFLNFTSGVVRSYLRLEGRWWTRSLAALLRDSFCTQLGCAQKVSTTDGFRLRLFAAPILSRKNTILTSIILRLMALVFRMLPFLHAPWKKLLATFVMGGRSAGRSTSLELVVITSPGKLGWSLEGDSLGWTPVEYGFFRHMASANYARVLLTPLKVISKRSD